LPVLNRVKPAIAVIGDGRGARRQAATTSAVARALLTFERWPALSPAPRRKLSSSVVSADSLNGQGAQATGANRARRRPASSSGAQPGPLREECEGRAATWESRDNYLPGERKKGDVRKKKKKKAKKKKKKKKKKKNKKK